MLTRLLVLAAVLSAPACLVVRDDGDGKGKEVNIATPVGGLAVETGEAAGDTGLPIYPGARRSTRDGDEERANVSIGTRWFGLHVRVAEYESTDAQATVLTYYREQMKAFGEVTECRGDVNFKNGRPVCKESAFERDVQLLTGTEKEHRVVAVKPRGAGSEIALVSIQTGG